MINFPFVCPVRATIHIMVFAAGLVLLLHKRPVFGPTTRPSASPLGEVEGCSGVAVAFSADSKYLLTAGRDSARVWTVGTFAPRTPVLRHGAGLQWAAISDDGNIVLTSASGTWRQRRAGEGKACIWDGRTGKLLFSIASHNQFPLRDASMSADGSRLATCAEGDANVRVWDVATQGVMREFHTLGKVKYVLLRRDAKRLLTVSDLDSRSLLWPQDGGAQLWDVETGRKIGPAFSANWSEMGFAMAPDTPRFAGFSHDGKLLAVAWKSELLIYDSESGRKRASMSLGRRARIAWVDLSADAGVVGMRSDHDGTTELNGRDCSRITDNFRRGGSAFDLVSPDGQFVAIDGVPDKAGLYDVRKGDRLHPFGEDYTAFACGCFSSDGKRLALGDAGELKTAVWSVKALTK